MHPFLNLLLTLFQSGSGLRIKSCRSGEISMKLKNKILPKCYCYVDIYLRILTFLCCFTRAGARNWKLFLMVNYHGHITISESSLLSHEVQFFFVFSLYPTDCGWRVQQMVVICEEPNSFHPYSSLPFICDWRSWFHNAPNWITPTFRRFHIHSHAWSRRNRLHQSSTNGSINSSRKKY